jgi:hypothetical protein
MREKYGWMAADSADKSKRTGCPYLAQENIFFSNIALSSFFCFPI